MEPTRDSSELGVTWLGHATARVDLDGVSVLTDPLLRSNLGPLHRYVPLPEASTWAGVDLVLISHLHRDHLDVPSLRAVGLDVPVIAPRGSGALLRAAGCRAVVELEPGEVATFGPLEVRATSARHSGYRPPFGPRAHALGYVLRGRHAIYFAGDTGLFPEMAHLAAEDLDLALLPVGGWGPTLRGGHLDVASAVEALRLIRPRAVVPVHWGTYWPRGLRRVRPERFARVGEDFARLAGSEVPDASVARLRPGERRRFAGLEAPRRVERPR